MATTDATIAHIMDEQEDIEITSSKCWNPIRPPATLLTSNGRRICIRPPFSAREYLMESSRSPLSNGSSLISEFHLVWPESQAQGAASPIMGLWACNFIWDPGPGGAHVGNKVDLHRQDQQPTERTSALVAGLTRTTSSRRPLETVYRLLRRSIFGQL
uniref:Retrotransposon, putative, centromere-specific n=1 Tax=Oryza sativa subsp. japonica TaxID=39947 RepID=Q6UUP5_ORYSJ|nr:hypothetical protein OSJNBa0079I01.41 [Oryza sativa Japonica Group]